MCRQETHSDNVMGISFTEVVQPRISEQGQFKTFYTTLKFLNKIFAPSRSYT